MGSANLNMEQICILRLLLLDCQKDYQLNPGKHDLVLKVSPVIHYRIQ